MIKNIKLRLKNLDNKYLEFARKKKNPVEHEVVSLGMVLKGLERRIEE